MNRAPTENDMAENEGIGKKAATSALLLGGSAIGSFAAIQTLAQVPPWIQTLIAERGLDYVFSFAILGTIVYLGPRFIASQKDQAVALTRLSSAVENLPQRDDMKFEAILIGQEMLNRSMDGLSERLRDIEVKINGARE